MTDKEKLIELIEQAYFCDIEHLADHLIANSVFVLTKPESKTIEFPRFRYNPEPQTNADRIRAMSDEELAEFLCSIAYARNTPWSEPFATKFCKRCPTIEGTIRETGKTMDFHECDFVDGKCPHGSDTVWWLKQPVKDGEDDG